MKKFAVIGSPISHSLSPSIHAAFGELSGIDLSYKAMEVKESDFTKKVNLLLDGGYEGINVTLPLKKMAYEISNVPSKSSTKSKSANVIWKKKGKIYCENTDGKGLLKDFEDKEISIQSRNLLLIGAGGAALSILPSLIEHKPKEIKIINRTVSKAQELVKKFENEGVKLSAGSLSDPLSFENTAIINSSSAGVLKEVISIPEGVFFNQDWVYDLSYSDSETPFNSLARKSGVKKTYDGFGMLIHQAAISFEIWTGKKPDTKRVTKILRPGS